LVLTASADDRPSHIGDRRHRTRVNSGETDSMNCPECSAPVRPGSLYCSVCGTMIGRRMREVNASSPRMECPACGHGNEGTSKFCVMCGARLEATPSEPLPLDGPAISGNGNHSPDRHVIFVDHDEPGLEEAEAAPVIDP